MRVDVWSDIVCPWCYIGHARLRKAAAQEGVALEVHHRAFLLDPFAEHVRPTVEALQDKYGPQAPHLMRNAEQVARAEGLPADLMASVSAPSRSAHAVVLAAPEEAQAEVLDDLFRAHFAQGRDISDDGLLREVRERHAVPEPGDEAHGRIEEDLAMARGIGIRGVPFFVFEGRVAVSGAQPLDVFVQAMRQAAAPRPPT